MICVSRLEMNLLSARPVSFKEPTIMRACHARFLFSAALALALAAFDPSPLMAAAANSATASAAPPPPATPDLTKEISLVSHRAVYELTLLKSVGSNSSTAAQGRIAFDFTGSACDGYVQNFRQLTELQPRRRPHPYFGHAFGNLRGRRRPEFRLQDANKHR